MKKEQIDMKQLTQNIKDNILPQVKKEVEFVEDVGYNQALQDVHNKLPEIIDYIYADLREKIEKHPAYPHLFGGNWSQLDEDGTMVGVPRQAIEEIEVDVCPYCDSEDFDMIGDAEYNDWFECEKCKQTFSRFITKTIIKNP